MATITFTVFGEPQTQGSKKVVPIMKAGKPVIKNGRALTRAVNDNPKLSAWRQEVAQQAVSTLCEITGESNPELLTGAIRLGLHFYRPRPQSHLGTGRNSGFVKPSAPEYPTTQPDTLKLGRAIEDALTGVIWKDDSQVVRHEIAKDYGPRYCVEVEIETLGEEALVTSPTRQKCKELFE